MMGGRCGWPHHRPLPTKHLNTGATWFGRIPAFSVTAGILFNFFFFHIFKILSMLILSVWLVKMSFPTYITPSLGHKHLVTLPIPTTVLCA